MVGSRRRNTEVVLDLLQKANKPLTAYQILDLARPSGISAPPTIYRALQRLQRRGLVHRLEMLNAFVLCREKESSGKLASFMLCEDCGTVEEIHDERLDQIFAEWRQRMSFTLTKQTVEMLGHCQSCSQHPGKAA